MARCLLSLSRASSVVISTAIDGALVGIIDRPLASASRIWRNGHGFSDRSGARTVMGREQAIGPSRWYHSVTCGRSSGVRGSSGR
jgi:hypothetical protein